MKYLMVVRDYCSFPLQWRKFNILCTLFSSKKPHFKRGARAICMHMLLLRLLISILFILACYNCLNWLKVPIWWKPRQTLWLKESLYFVLNRVLKKIHFIDLLDYFRNFLHMSHHTLIRARSVSEMRDLYETENLHTTTTVATRNFLWAEVSF